MVCLKSVAGRSPVEDMETKVGKDWKVRAPKHTNRDSFESEKRGEGETSAAEEREREGEYGMITVSMKDWEEIRLIIASLSETNDEIVKGNEILQQELHKMTTRVQSWRQKHSRSTIKTNA